MISNKAIRIGGFVCLGNDWLNSNFIMYERG